MAALTPKQYNEIQKQAINGFFRWLLVAAALIIVASLGLFYTGVLSTLAVSTVLGISALPVLGVAAGVVLIASGLVGYWWNKFSARKTAISEQVAPVVEPNQHTTPVEQTEVPVEQREVSVEQTGNFTEQNTYVPIKIALLPLFDKYNGLQRVNVGYPLFGMRNRLVPPDLQQSSERSESPSNRPRLDDVD